MDSCLPPSYDNAPAIPSLAEVHGTVSVPSRAGFWGKLFAFSGPGFLVAVGYMDQGNWATDIAGGSQSTVANVRANLPSIHDTVWVKQMETQIHALAPG